MRPIRRALLAGSTAAAVVVGCSPAPPPSDRVIVFAAASLNRAFTEIGERFTAADPAASVDLSFAGSADLLAQLTGGAPADVVATADDATMRKAVDAGLVGPSTALATNILTIAVAPGNPLRITGFADLHRATLVTCAPQVPCGAAVRRIEGLTGVTLSPVSQENSVSDVLNKVRTGQADAGLVYRTDARAAGKAITAVEFPEASRAVNTYRIAVTTTAADPALAREFVDLASGPTGRAVLTRLGFGDP